MAYYSDRLQWRGPFILICLPFSIIGKILPTPCFCRFYSHGFPFPGYIIAITASNDSTRYVAVFFMAAGVWVVYMPVWTCAPLLSILSQVTRPVLVFCTFQLGHQTSTGLIWASQRSILPNNSRGHYKKATTTALQLAIANTGSVKSVADTPFNFWPRGQL